MYSSLRSWLLCQNCIISTFGLPVSWIYDIRYIMRLSWLNNRCKPLFLMNGSLTNTDIKLLILNLIQLIGLINWFLWIRCLFNLCHFVKSICWKMTRVLSFKINHIIRIILILIVERAIEDLLCVHFIVFIILWSSLKYFLLLPKWDFPLLFWQFITRLEIVIHFHFISYLWNIIHPS